MNAAVLVIFGLVWLVFAYFWYGNKIKNKVLKSSDSNITPANTVNDGIDYVPTKPAILYGHHFSSIAGAGPIVGPILAFALFGWVPAMIWILVGSVFMGAVHDYTTLIVSARHKGISIVEITESVVSKRASFIFSIFCWLTLVLLLSVFIDLTTRTLVDKPEIVIPTFGIMFVALLFGISVYKLKINVAIATVIALIMFLGLILLGDAQPIQLSYDIWLYILLIYCFVASTLPVWILLQPRDYLSMYLLIIGMALGIIGIVILHPQINGPAYISFNSKSGPLFPMLFITIACGALSGFHAVVSSGTSAKQLRKESDGKIIAFGAMLTEGLVALLVLALISSVLIWKTDGTVLPAGRYFFQDLLTQNANIVFGTSLGIVLEKLGIPLFFGIAFGILMLNAFLITTLDTTSRLARYIMEETIGIKLGGIFKNKYFATALGLFFAFLLCQTQGYKTIWPIFGASNQLIGTITLFVITTYLMGIKSPKRYTFIPALIMLAITESALFYQMLWSFLPKGQYVLSVVCGLLFA
ncbi:MAG: carbon starvation protein, partial [Bacteroidota bacterium]|nr:carbon starvation protein [Bacteroidota bacterium]